jgi:hypothetical protein
MKMAKSLPDTHSERTYMDNKYEDKPGYANLFYTAPQDKKYPQSPDYDGSMILKMDYKAGEKIKLDVWYKETRTGKPMLSIKENSWLKEKALEKAQPTEVTPTYRQPPKTGYRKRDDDDIPFN